MSQQSNFSDEVLNAYVDGELSAEDELSILEAMQRDAVFSNRVNELKRLKLLVATTYRDNRSKNKLIENKNTVRWSLVASVLLTVGIVSGWLSHDALLNNDSVTLAMTDKSNPEKNIEEKTLINKNQVGKNKDTWNIVLHVNSNDEYIQKTILDETESLLESFKGSRQKVRVEIVAYGKGVFLFDSEKSKYKKRLSSLKSNFSNLSYAVCGRTIKRLEKVEMRKIYLVPNLTVARSGIYQIIKRQKQGWNYIRI